MDKNSKQEEMLSLYYYQITDLWKRLCEDHTRLLDLTCDEYSSLLSNDLDELEQIIESKNKLIQNLNGLDKLRQELIDKINNLTGGPTKISSVSDLLNIMQRYEAANNQNHLQRFNKLLIDIIEKIQKQNKRNQIFINKAIISLREIREHTLGERKFATYTAKGTKSNVSEQNII